MHDGDDETGRGDEEEEEAEAVANWEDCESDGSDVEDGGSGDGERSVGRCQGK